MTMQVEFPLALLNLFGIAGIVVWHLIPRRHTTARLVVQLGFFTVMTGVLLYYGVVPYRLEGYGGYQFTDVTLILAKTLWWVHLAWAVIGFVRLYLVIEGHPQQARLLQDILVAVIYLGVALAILSFVFGTNVSTLVATSGVVAITVGLALQNTLGDVFSGIALTLGRPYRLGDLVVLADGTEGRVVETDWRSTHVLTAANNVIVLPNSVLAKMIITNLGRPDGSHVQSLTLRVAPTQMPSMVIGVMREALSRCSVPMSTPEPLVALKSLGAEAIVLELSYWVKTPADRIPARNEIFDIVYQSVKEASLELG